MAAKESIVELGVLRSDFLIPALGRQRQADLCEFETSLVYRASARTGSKATEKPCLEKPKNKKKEVTSGQVVVAYAFNSSTGRQRPLDICEFKASLIYRVNSRTVRATQRPCLEHNNQKRSDIHNFLCNLSLCGSWGRDGVGC
ncbi:hypothetical protein ACRRTK_009794 [Alexandromys fortis]